MTLQAGQEGDDRFKPAPEVAFGKAADFSRGLFKHVSANDALLRRILVLNVSRSPLKSDDLKMIFLAAPGLIRIDASRCSLEELPEADLFQSLRNLKVTLFHQNALRRWQDVLSICCCPALIWMTIFQNPVAGDPTVRSVVLAEKPSILAVDHRMVTEPERLGPEWDVVSAVLSRSRFGARLLDPDSLDLKVQGPRRDVSFEEKDQFMVQLALQEIRFIENHYKSSSPTRCIQAVWRGFHVRQAVEQHKAQMVEAARKIQRGARRLLWRKHMAEYVKEYLGHIDELDLLLDAKEMLRRRALKLIEARVRRWILQRSLQRRERKAAELINRYARSCLVRRRLLYAQADLHQHRSFYFPERHAWEFHVLCNLVLRAHGLPVLPAEHTFQDADVLGIRFPEFNEAPRRQSTLLRFLGFASRVVLRPLRCGRFPEYDWDGPFHRLVGKEAGEGGSKVRRRGDSCNTRCRKAFQSSCCSGEHPVRRVEAGESQECVLLKELLEGPENQWPAEAQRDSPLRAFLLEAKRLKPKSWHHCWVRPTAEVDARGLRNYSHTAWLSQRVLMIQMPTAQAALEMCYALHEFSRLARQLPSVEAIPALYGKAVAEIAAATVIQACWRAHQDRASIGESLKAVVLGRRAAICIQRCWRWNLVKRRMELLTGALNLTRAIRSPVLYIEERLFLGLNTISAVDRYPRFRESQLAFGFSVASEAPVLLRNQARGKAQQPYCQEERSGLPQWFLQETQLAVHDAELKLRPVRGLQGLLLEGLGSEERTIEVSSPFLETFARTCAAGGMDKELEEVGVTQAALAASGGTLRYLELRFPTVLQARQRALLLYLCTFNFDKHAAVPVFVRHQLYDADATYGVLRLWDLYGLDWPRASKAGIFLLRARDPKPSEVILANGSKVRGAAELRAEWQSAEEDQRRASLAQVHAERELQRLERLNKKKRNADVEEIMQQLSTVPPQELLEALQSGKLPSSVDSQLVEAWILGNRLNFSGRVVDKKQLAKRAASEKLAMRKLLAAAKEQGATRDFGDRGAEDRELARQWEARLMEFYARANDDRVAEEARCLVEARRANGEGPDRWLVDVEASERHRSPLEVDSEYDHAQSMRGSSAPHVYEQLEQSQGLLPEDPGKTAAVEESPSMEGLENVRAGEGPAKNDVCGGWYVSKKASKAARQELRQMAATFSSRRCFLQRVHKVADVRQIKAAREDQNRARLHDYRTAWAARTQILATKHGSMLDHQRRDLDDLRSHLGNLSELQKQQTSEDLQSKREAILEQKVTKRLRAQLHGSPSPWGGMTIGMPSFPEEAFAMRFPCKLAKTFQSGTESTRASNLGSTLQDLRLSHADATDATWTEAKGTQQMASTMQSLPSQAQGELARPMAATDGWHQVRPPPPRQLPLRPPRPSPKERGGFWVKQGALSARTKGSHS